MYGFFCILVLPYFNCNLISVSTFYYSFDRFRFNFQEQTRIVFTCLFIEYIRVFLD